MTDNKSIDPKISEYFSKLGKKGGEAVKKKYGKDYYKKIGEMTKKKHGIGYYSRLGMLSAIKRKEKREQENDRS